MIRYSVCYRSSQPYQIDNPQVYEQDGVRSEQSLYGFVNSQLED